MTPAIAIFIWQYLLDDFLLHYFCSKTFSHAIFSVQVTLSGDDMSMETLLIIRYTKAVVIHLKQKQKAAAIIRTVIDLGMQNFQTTGEVENYWR